MSDPSVPRPSLDALPPEVQAYLAFLEEQIRLLQEENADLRARLQRNSRNSSQPPSADPPSAPKRPPRPSQGRSRGGQKGHPGHHRALVPADRVDHRREHWPAACPHCQHDLTEVRAERVPARRQQVWELPPVRAEVTEHRYHAVTCPACGAPVRAQRTFRRARWVPGRPPGWACCTGATA